MPQNHKKFHSVDGKRQILVVDDELINRNILGEILKTEYDVLYAEDGLQALQMIRENRDTLSLVLLDILMPGMSGIEVLQEVKKDKEIAQIPIIVITSEQSAEVDSLKKGAIDFIPKPYPAVDVILARVLRTIELSEDRNIIQSTERDTLTGLYNREFFYSYALQYDQFHKDKKMDAIILDINRFHMVNERYGKAFGDEVLKKIAATLKDLIKDSDGIVCRRGGDTFLIYCPHRDDYQAFLDDVSASIDEEGNNRIRLRMGVYTDVDKDIEMERRFDRAKMAADSVKGSFSKTIGFYDDRLRQQELYAVQLIEEFPEAIRTNQFHVYYQPKFDIRPEVPILCSAEALVRWIHPKLGMISPGVFIPLFEDNGLIQQLDLYVWERTAEQIGIWKEKLGYSIPVSVNVSRVDMYDPDLIDKLKDIIDRHGLSCTDFILEITESIYVDDHSQLIETADRLRELGFRIEMDDFGTGYSSLNMISNLPIDALKLDMHFIREAFKEGGNTHMIEVVIEIAGYLSVPVVAEGVENEEQLDALKKLGCDIVQGYYFSKPVVAEEFEAFILQKKEADRPNDSFTLEKSEDLIHNAQLKHVFGSQIDDYRNPEETEKVKEKGIRLKTVSYLFAILAALAAFGMLFISVSITDSNRRMEEAGNKYVAAQIAASNMETGSDYLTDSVRSFVITGDLRYLERFFEEVNETKTRDHAVDELGRLLGDTENSALDSLNRALSLSNELVEIENLAMRLAVEAGDYDTAKIPAEILSMTIPEEYASLEKEELQEAAKDLVFGSEYTKQKELIKENVHNCTQTLISNSSEEFSAASSRLSLLVGLQRTVTLLFLFMIVAMIALISRFVRKPLTAMVEQMRRGEMVSIRGVAELNYAMDTYNRILEENQEARKKLSHEASHDALTGLFNRGAYDMLMENVDSDHMALIMVDVDSFKQINDEYGHDIGDRVLKKVAEILKQSFRSVDIICRYGGDEFIVVMTRVNSSMQQLVVNKMNRAIEILMNPQDDLPPVSLSVGVAFADRKNPQNSIFKDADTALYQAKEAGKSAIVVF